MDERHLPTGHHRGLDITVHTISTGGFTLGGRKLIWHTTEGLDFGVMARVLREKGAEPHVLIDPRAGKVLQMIPFDQYAKALEHPQGTLETNRAHCIQVEICEYAKNSPHWSEHIYRNLARLALLIEHRTGVPRKARHPFGLSVPRLTPKGFLSASGHLGHQHVPNNTHWDPGAMRIGLLLKLMGDV